MASLHEPRPPLSFSDWGQGLRSLPEQCYYTERLLHIARFLGRPFPRGVSALKRARREHLFRLFQAPAVIAALPPLGGLAYYEQKTYLAGLLRRADRMSMRHGVELRVPLLDHRIVGRLNAMHAGRKAGLTVGSEKTILKRIGEGKLPPFVMERRKYGFGTPLGRYRGGLRAGLTGCPEEFRADHRLSDQQLWVLASAVPRHVRS